MKIAFVTSYFSEGMGYTENMLPKALAHLGHDVHVVASTLQVYGNRHDYVRNYESFLGPAECSQGESIIDGFTLHRMPFYTIENNVGLCGLKRILRDIRPAIVQFGAAAGLPALTTLLYPGRLQWPVFTENHQHLSIAWRSQARSFPTQQWEILRYRLTRTWPASLAHRRVEKCFAIADDCVETASSLYGIPKEKIIILPLGTDTELFRPCGSEADREERAKLRRQWGAQEEDLLCIYTGRLSAPKNPLLLAHAIAELRRSGQPYRAVFVGEGSQGDAIRATPGCSVVPFVKHVNLAAIYRAADLGVWPSQESMSMLDAAASGLPLVVSDQMGELERVNGNGCTFQDGSVSSLVQALLSLQDKQRRQHLSSRARHKMVSDFSWKKHAEIRVQYYNSALRFKPCF